MSASYTDFLTAKANRNAGRGFEPVWLPDFLFDFQRALVEWAVRQGSAALLADCGLGKTPMQLVWAENVVRKTSGRVLVLAPLAVAPQTIREGAKFGIEVRRSWDGSTAHQGITITNYERLHLFDPADFVGLVCDESSILKSFNGVLRGLITSFMRRIRYGLLCTATAAPNDHTELGTSAEALGYLGHVDMLNRFFRQEGNQSYSGRRFFRKTEKWRFKGHAEDPFWRWVCSWARALRRPSDLGFEDRGFALSPLEEREHTVTARVRRPGALFEMPAGDLREEQEERRRTIPERCERIAALVSHDRQAIVWCHLNAEGDLLEKLIGGAVQVSGADSDEAKEERFVAFAAEQARVLVTKPVVGAWGLNFQNCAHAVTFASHSFEQYYQAVRRCWRFGQTEKVVVDVVATEGERGVLDNLRRKGADADRMFARLVEHMGDSMKIDRGRPQGRQEEVPPWLSQTRG